MRRERQLPARLAAIVVRMLHGDSAVGLQRAHVVCGESVGECVSGAEQRLRGQFFRAEMVCLFLSFLFFSSPSYPRPFFPGRRTPSPLVRWQTANGLLMRKKKCSTASASPFCGLLFKTVSGVRYENLECATAASSSVELFLTSSSSSSSRRSSSSSSKVSGKSTSTKTTTRTSSSGSTTRKSSSSHSSSRSGSNTSTTTRQTTSRLNSTTKFDASQATSVQQTPSEIVTVSSLGAGAPSATASAARAPLEGVDAFLGMAGYVFLGLLAALSS